MKAIIETTMIYSVAGLLGERADKKKTIQVSSTFASTTSIVGGGNDARPGEISLAHNGVLFMDTGFRSSKRCNRGSQTFMLEDR